MLLFTFAKLAFKKLFEAFCASFHTASNTILGDCTYGLKSGDLQHYSDKKYTDGTEIVFNPNGQIVFTWKHIVGPSKISVQFNLIHSIRIEAYNSDGKEVAKWVIVFLILSVNLVRKKAVTLGDYSFSIN